MLERIYKCPVCNFKGLFEPAYREDGVGSDDICPCCGFQFGLDNFNYPTKEEAHQRWRKKWIDEGCIFWSAKTFEKYVLKGWDPAKQLQGVEIKTIKYKCPICNFMGLYDPAYDENGIGLYDECACCGFRFGLHDSDYPTKEEAHAKWRKKWIQGGCVWHSKTTLQPQNWDPTKQLEELT